MLLDDFIYIRQKLNTSSVSSNEIVGKLTPKDDEIPKLKSLAENGCIDSFVLIEKRNRSIDDIAIGNEVEIKLYPLNLGTERYFENVEELLKSYSQVYSTNRFFVQSLNYDSNSDKKPTVIENYRQITKLIGFLTKLSDYQKERELVFFKSKQLIILTSYTITELVDLKDIDELISHIINSADTEERKIIFINELIASLYKIPEVSLRFKFLIQNFSDFFINYQKSHSLYLEKYSYTKFKSELDKEIIDYSKKLQSVINDAQGKLIAIPAAFLLIIGQIDLTGIKFFLNVSLLLSSLVFSLLLELMLRNQFSALQFIADDVERFKSSTDEKKVVVIGDDFDKAFKKLRNAYTKQKVYLKIIRFIVWFTPSLALILFILSLIPKEYASIFRILYMF